MALLDRIEPAILGPTLEAAAADGWLIYDFHGLNPVARRVVGAGGMGTRRLFVWLPAAGKPVAITHRIELQGVDGFPGEVRAYAGWEELHRLLGDVVSGQRVAMEISPDDAVPYLDRIPFGVVGLVERLGGKVVPSGPLVSRFAAGWSPDELQDHRDAAEKIAAIAQTVLPDVVSDVGSAREFQVQQRVLDAFDEAGLVTNDPPIVAFGPNAANPHYEPHEGADRVLHGGDVVLLDLWAGKSRNTVFADQTWMAFAGAALPDEVVQVWTATREARDAVVEHLRKSVSAGRSVTGADLDDVARGLLRERGYGDAFVHRTGHSIDIELHGSGPHLDNFETNDTREIIPGVGFSVEPGVYLKGRFGVRSEINVVLHDDGPEITPAAPQTDLILAG